MKRLAHSFAWYLYWLAAFLLALIAVLLISAKLLFEDIDNYRMQVQSYLSEQLQAQVHIGQLQGSWTGWKPNLQMRSLSISNLKEQPGLSVGLLQAQIEIDPAASLKIWAPVFSQFEFDGLKVRYDLSALPQSSEPKSATSASHRVTDTGASILTLLLQQQNIDLSKTRIELVSKTGEELAISPIHLQMQHDGVMHQLQINADLSTQDGQAKVGFVAEVEGNPSKDLVDFYLNIEGLNHKLLNPWLRLADVELESYEASQQIWGRIDSARLIYLTGTTQVRNFQFREYQLDEFSLQTALIRRDNAYQLQINDVYVSGAQQHLDLPQVSLDLVRRGYTIEPQTLMVDKVDLGKAQAWLLQQPFLPEEAASVIKTLSPQGVLQNIKVSWTDAQELKSFQLAADLKEVGIEAWDDVPELKGVNGLLQADINGGQIHLTSQAFSMHYPTLFQDKWSYGSADGIIGWRFEDRGVVVASQLLHLSDQFLSAAGRFSIYLPYSRDDQPLLNLQIGLKASDGKQARYYIPPKEVGEKTYEWLVAAIKDGHVKQAGFVLNGVTRSRLPDYQLPVVQMFFDLSDASFEYQPGWPAIQQSEAFVFFRNGELVARAKGGQLYDSAIDYAWVHLPETTDKLFVNGAVKGEAEDIYKLLTQSPLKEEVGEELAAWKMSGAAATAVDLQIPLYSGKTPQVFVSTVVQDAHFESEKERLHFSAVNGEVKYDSNTGLQAEKLNARLFQQPVTARIESNNRKTQVFIDSAVEAKQLQAWLDLSFFNVVKGKIDYQARLDMCPGKSCNQLVISSDLQGVEIDAPQPLAKVASQKSYLSIVSDLGRGYKDDRSAVRLNLGNQLRGILVTKGQEIERARFSLGGERPEVPKQPGIWLEGQLGYIDYDELERFINKAGLVTNEPAKASSGKGAATKLRAIDLGIEHFVFNKIQLNALQVNLMPVELGWQLKVSSPDVAGTLLLPQDNNTPYRADLEYLRLTTSDENEEIAEVSSDEPPVDAKDLPHLLFKVQELTLDEKPLGQWGFELVPIVNGIVVENIRADLHGAVAKGEVRWRSEDDPRSYLTLRLDSDDFGKVLEAWGISKSLETKTLKSYVQLNWDGTPWAFDIAKADGEVQFTAKNGRLLDVGNAGNFLRVFGILNMQSVGRRLRLDFSDLFKEGVAFDEMKASYVIDNGIATTSEPFVMVGPSVNMALKGNLDLKNETVDKDIEVAIPVTGNIPLISVLLGAPQVAGAVFLFDKLVGDPLEKFSTVKYHMSGPWADPQIEVYNDKEKLPPPPVAVPGDSGG